MRNYIQSPTELMHGLINKNGTMGHLVTPGNVVFGQPATELDGPATTTRLGIRGVQGSVFSNRPTTILYDRLDLGVLFQGDYRPKLTTLTQSSLHRLLPKLNALLGLRLTERDVEDVDLTEVGEGSEITLELKARPGSLAFTGFTRILFNRRWLMLTDMVEVTTFDEYRHPDPILADHSSAGLLTWGQDFTLIASALAVNPRGNKWTGEWTDHAALQIALGSVYGMDNWPLNARAQAGTLKDYDTREVPNANTNYQRVVVQSNIRANGYIGTAYFHYNT